MPESSALARYRGDPGLNEARTIGKMLLVMNGAWDLTVRQIAILLREHHFSEAEIEQSLPKAVAIMAEIANAPPLAALHSAPAASTGIAPDLVGDEDARPIADMLAELMRRVNLGPNCEPWAQLGESTQRPYLARAEMLIALAPEVGLALGAAR